MIFLEGETLAEAEGAGIGGETTRAFAEGGGATDFFVEPAALATDGITPLGLIPDRLLAAPLEALGATRAGGGEEGCIEGEGEPTEATRRGTVPPVRRGDCLLSA